MIKFKIKNVQISIMDMAYFVGSIVALIICLLNPQTTYVYVVILPLFFIVCFVFLLMPSCKKSLTAKIATFCLFLRYSALPAVQSINPVYSFSSYSCTDEKIIGKAVSLMCYELIVLSAFIALYTYTHKKVDTTNLKLNSNDNRFIKQKNRYSAIFLFSIVAIILGILNPKVIKQISFIFIKSNSDGRMGQISASSNSIDMIMRQIFVIGVLSLFVITVVRLKNKYYQRFPKMVIRLSLVGALCCTCMIIAEQRSSQIYCAFASIILLIQLFPKEKNKITKIMIGGAAIVLIMLTIYKTFYAFNYDSYADAIANSSSDMSDLVQTMEIYLLGPITVASAIEFGAIYSGLSLGQLLFDIGRSTIGVSFLVKSQNFVMTSASYNLFVTAGRSASGYLLPITGQGYIFLGFILSPILICICIYFAFRCERLMFSSKSAYVVYFSAYVFIRLSTCMVSSNLNTVLNAVSSIMISAGVIYIMQWFLNKLTSIRSI